MSDFAELSGIEQDISQGFVLLIVRLENYARCYGKNKLPFGKRPGLIVIDAVRAYLDPSCPLYAPDRFEVARQSMVRLIEKCRSMDIPVVFSSVMFSKKTGNNGGN